MIKIGLFEAAFLGWICATHGVKDAAFTLLAFVVGDVGLWLYGKFRELSTPEQRAKERAEDIADLKRDWLPLACIFGTCIIMMMSGYIIRFVSSF